MFFASSICREKVAGLSVIGIVRFGGAFSGLWLIPQPFDCTDQFGVKTLGLVESVGTPVISEDMQGQGSCSVAASGGFGVPE